LAFHGAVSIFQPAGRAFEDVSGAAYGVSEETREGNYMADEIEGDATPTSEAAAVNAGPPEAKKPAKKSAKKAKKAAKKAAKKPAKKAAAADGGEGASDGAAPAKRAKKAKKAKKPARRAGWKT